MAWIGAALARARAFRKTTEVTIAVAGLSKSGKTAFITSVIANLIAAQAGGDAAKRLQGFSVVDQGRLRAAAIPAVYAAKRGKRFPYAQMMQALSGESAAWPRRTDDAYEIAVDLQFRPAETAPDYSSVGAARLRVVLVDYPGEWLVDVPLVEQSFADWSAQVLARLEHEPWNGLSREFRAMLGAGNWSDADNDSIARQAALEWQRVLAAARLVGLKWLQPGRFLRSPGADEERPEPPLDDQNLWFCPLPRASIERAGRGSLARGMAERYSNYQRHVKQFIGTTLAGATRHAVLVDVLDSLANGMQAFEETSQVVHEVYRILAIRRPGWFASLFGGGSSSLDRVLFLATKADTVPSGQRANLVSLLASMRLGMTGRVGAEAGMTSEMSVAAIRSTIDTKRVIDGIEVPFVEGVCAERGRTIQAAVLNIPDKVPDPVYWRHRSAFELPRFVPPKISAGGRQGIANVRLGDALEFLIGDLTH